MTVFYKHARSHVKISGFQGDAMHVRKSGTIVEGVRVKDPYDEHLFDMAHRDAIQIIPSKIGEPYYQFAGGISKGIVLRNNFIYSENHLQGIFSSDGGHVNLTIENNHIVTNSPHHISIAGLFSGVINQNITTDLSLCPINLFPLRVGGNSDGQFNVWIIHFRNCPYKYEPLKNIINTKPYSHVTDNRTGSMIRNTKDVYLHSFNYPKFRESVTQIQLTPNDIRELALDFGKQDT